MELRCKKSLEEGVNLEQRLSVASKERQAIDKKCSQVRGGGSRTSLSHVDAIYCLSVCVYGDTNIIIISVAQ